MNIIFIIEFFIIGYLLHRDARVLTRGGATNQSARVMQRSLIITGGARSLTLSPSLPVAVVLQSEPKRARQRVNHHPLQLLSNN